MDNEASGYNGARPQAGRALMGELQGNTGQVGGDKAPRKEGVYRHKITGAEVITQHDPVFGDGQSRAAERAGFVFVREADPSEKKTLGAPSADFENRSARPMEAQAAYNKGLEARLNALEADNARLRNQLGDGAPTPIFDNAAHVDATKQAAADKVERQTGTAVDPSTGDVNDASLSDLRAQAKELGLPAGGTKEDLTQRIAQAKAGKES